MRPTRTHITGAVVLVLVWGLVIAPWIGGMTWERERGPAYRCELQYRQWETQNPGRMLRIRLNGSLCGQMEVAR